jgi:hypothetical protein
LKSSWMLVEWTSEMYIRQLMHLTWCIHASYISLTIFCVTEDMAMEGRMGSAGERNGITT